MRIGTILILKGLNLSFLTKKPISMLYCVEYPWIEWEIVDKRTDNGH